MNPAIGEFIGESAWDFEGMLRAEAEFRAVAAGADADWAWWRLVGGPDGLDETLVTLRGILSRSRRWG